MTKLTTLEKLEICDCDGVDAFFAQLSKPHIRPAKLKFLRWMDDETAQPHAMEAFEGLLEMTSGLEVLHLWLDEMDAVPKAGAITRHKKTLTSLGIHCQKNRDKVHSYTEDDYREICNQCTEIRQLSLAFPQLESESEYLSADFDTFLVCGPMWISDCKAIFNTFLAGPHFEPSTLSNLEYVTMAVSREIVQLHFQRDRSSTPLIRAPSSALQPTHF